jgi:nucleotide-binding universal stress UspA family protein
MSKTSTRRRAAVVATSLCIAFAGAAWSGCGDDDEAQKIQDQVNQQLEDAGVDAQEIQDQVEQQLEDAGADAEEIQKQAEEAADKALDDSGY